MECKQATQSSTIILRVAVAEMMTYPKTSIGIIISEYIMLTEFSLLIKNFHLLMQY